MILTLVKVSSLEESVSIACHHFFGPGGEYVLTLS